MLKSFYMTKYLIAVVEDEEQAFLRLQEQINRFSKENNNVEFDIHWFNNGPDFLNDKTIFSVIFFDIELGLDNGLELAREVRERNSVSSIVFITNLAKYAQFGYEVNAISYLIKPVEYNAFSIVFKKALNAFSANEENDMMFRIPGGVEMTSINKIMYIEIVSHIIIYHLVDGTIEKAGSLSQIEKELKGHGFIRCHHAFIVNPNFIKGINKNDIIVGTSLVPLARSKKKEVLEALSKFYLQKG